MSFFYYVSNCIFFSEAGKLVAWRDAKKYSFFMFSPMIWSMAYLNFNEKKVFVHCLTRKFSFLMWYLVMSSTRYLIMKLNYLNIILVRIIHFWFHLWSCLELCLFCGEKNSRKKDLFDTFFYQLVFNFLVQCSYLLLYKGDAWIKSLCESFVVLD